MPSIRPSLSRRPRLPGLIRKALASALAAAVVTTSSVPSLAGDEVYYFRHKAPISWTGGSPVDPTDPETEFGVGNDITAYFTGIVGQSFSKTIPVATTDVVEWRVLSGRLQDGLTLDAATGVISGVPQKVSGAPKATLLGYDASAKLIARAAITFTFRDPVGAPQEASFYGHVDKYLYREIPSPAAVYRWESLLPLPDDFRTEGKYLVGTPKSEYLTSVAFVGYDFADREVAFTWGDLLVEDGPKVDFIADQMRHPTNTFAVNPHVEHKVGELAWRVVPLDGKPKTLSINAKTGRFAGTIPTFDTSLRFRLEAMDADGTRGQSNVFTLSTSGPDVDIASLGDLTGAVGKPFLKKLTGSDLTGTMDWQVAAGTLPEGITLDRATGEISGVPTKVEEQTGIVITVITSDGGSAVSPAFKFTVFPEAIGLTFASKDVRVGTEFATDGPTLGTGIVEPYRFDVAEGATVPEEVEVDAASAVVTGTAEEAGDLGVAFRLLNGDGREAVALQPITAYAELGLSYDSPVVVYRRVPATVLPTVADDSVIGTAAFALTDGSLPAGLSFDPLTGAITGTPEEEGDATDLEVALTDDSGETAVSNVFDVQVLDRPDVEVSISAPTVERVVDNEVTTATAANAFDGVSFALETGDLPDGLRLDQDGVIRGTTTDPVGVYDGFTVRATDGEGYTTVSAPFSVTVVAPTSLKPLEEVALSYRWTVGVPFDFALPRPSNAFGDISYLVANLPDGVEVVGERLAGQVDELGTYSLPMTLTDFAGRTLSGTLTLEIVPRMTAYLDGYGKRIGASEDEVFFDIPRGYDLTVAPVEQNAMAPVTYELVSGDLPDGLSFDEATGSVIGAATTEGETADIVIAATDAAGTRVELSATLTVVERLPISLSYAIPVPAGEVGKKLNPLAPTTANGIGPVLYTLEGTLPAGIEFNAATGYFFGTPLNDGWSGDLTVTAEDSEGPSFGASYGPFRLGVAKAGNVALPTTSLFVVRAGEDFERFVTAGNVTAPVTYSGPLSNGVTVGASDGKLSGNLPTPGKYGVGTVTATDALQRSGSTSVEFTAVGPLSIAVPTVVEFPQYSTVSTAAKATNAIGLTRYELVSGTLPAGLSLNATTGSITGFPTVKGTASNLVVKVTDSTGSSSQTGAFSLTVGDRLPLELNTPPSYTIYANHSWNRTLPVSNAVYGATFVLTGALPTGISFDATKGAFLGVSRVLGTFPVTVTVTDGVGEEVTKSFDIVSELDGQPIGLTVFGRTVVRGSALNTTRVLVSNTIGEVTLWADDEVLTAHGLSFDPATGSITGPVPDLMEIAPNVHVTDESGRVTSKPVNIRVIPEMTVNAPERIEVPVNKRIFPYLYVSAENPTASVKWDYTGTLPAGVTFSKSLGRFSGTPKELGVSTVTLSVAEQDGPYWQVARKDVEIAVVSDGIAPTVSVTPSSTGYLVGTAYTLTPKYTSQKKGDVVTLAPDSNPLPPGMTIGRLSATSDTFVLRKAKDLGSETAGVYEGIKLRVTAADGLYGDSEPFTIIYKAPPYYPNVTVKPRTYEPISVPVPTPTSGKTVGTLSYSIYSGYSLSTVSIDPSTGVVSGYVTKDSNIGVRVTESYGGVTLRTTTYSVYYRPVVLSMTVSNRMDTYTGMPFPESAYPVTLVNGLDSGSFTWTGGLPDGLTLNTTTGAFEGTPTTAGTFSGYLVYSDAYETISRPVTLYVEQSAAAGEGYKYVRFSLTGPGQAHLSGLTVRNQAGQGVMHVSTLGAGTFSAGGLVDLLSASHKNNLGQYGGYQVIELPVYVSKGSVAFYGHRHGSTSAMVSASVDGQTWVDIQSVDITSYGSLNYNVPFSYSPPIIQPEVPLGGAKIVAGDNFTCSVNNNGAMTCWGHGASGQLGNGSTDNKTEPTDVQGLSSNVADIAAVNTRTCALKTDGTVWCWGSNTTSPVTHSSRTGFKQVAAGATTGFGIKSDNSLWRWSISSGSASQSSISGMPSNVSALIAAKYGNAVVCLITDDGKLWCEGNNSYGHLGNGNKLNAASSGYVHSLSNVVSASLGERHGCAAESDGTVWCWGGNSYGQLGIGNTTEKLSPVQVPGLTNVVSVWTGNNFTCAVKSDSKILCWGNNSYGQLGTGTKGGTVLSPVESTAVNSKITSTWSAVQMMALGVDHACILATNGNKWCWGRNNVGQLGDSTTTDSLQPVNLSGEEYSDGFAVQAGDRHACAVKSDGSAWCWGNGANGRLGTGNTASQNVPQKIIASDVVSISPGDTATCALKTDGYPWCWGNGYGSLPVKLTALNGVKQLSANGDHACAVKIDGTVSCWSWGGTPTAVAGLTDVQTVSAGYGYQCAVKSDGTIWCWGNGGDGKLGNGSSANETAPKQVMGLPTTGTGTVRVEAQWHHTCAIAKNKKAYCWGRNNFGQLGGNGTTSSNVPIEMTGMSDVTSISGGWQYTCLTANGGAAYCVGMGENGKLGRGNAANSAVIASPTGLTSGVSFVTIGGANSMAVKTDGTIWGWGRNSYGDLGIGNWSDQYTPVKQAPF